MCVGGGGRVTAGSIRRGQGQAIGRQGGGRQVTGFKYNKQASFRKDEKQGDLTSSSKAVMVNDPNFKTSKSSSYLNQYSRPSQVHATTSQADGALVNTMTAAPSRSSSYMRSAPPTFSAGSNLPVTDAAGGIAGPDRSKGRPALGVTAFGGLTAPTKAKVGGLLAGTRNASMVRGAAKGSQFEVTSVSKKGTATAVRSFTESLVARGGKVFTERTFGATFTRAGKKSFSATFGDKALQKTQVADEAGARKATRRSRSNNNITGANKILKGKRNNKLRINTQAQVGSSGTPGLNI